MVVGPTGGGKSSNIRVLQNALTKLKTKGIAGERFEKTRLYHLNPKSITMGQLYGKFDENTVRTFFIIYVFIFIVIVLLIARMARWYFVCINSYLY